MQIEDQLRERLTKVEALFFGATTAGERAAASAAAERLKAKLDEVGRVDPPVELKFTVPDTWSARLFIALCRRYGFDPFRYSRQRHTTIMVGRSVDSLNVSSGVSSSSCTPILPPASIRQASG